MKTSIAERFGLLRKLKEDVRSKTFLANDQWLGTENVLVKVLKKDHLYSNREQLLTHFSFFLGVRHPCLVDILDAGLTTKNDIYYVREYLAVQEAPHSDILKLVRLFASGLDFFQTHRQVHGGIKLSNVFVTQDAVKFADPMTPGLQTSRDDAIHFTAPEVLMGQSPTHAADLYSMGAVLYRMVTGRHVFQDIDLARLRSKYTSAFPQLHLSVMHPFAQPMLDLLSKEPQQRLAAFDRLKRAVGCEAVAASRAPFVGRSDILQQIIEFACTRTTNLKTLLIEGEGGLGKSRVLEEIRAHLSFRSYALLHFTVRDADVLTRLREDIERRLVPRAVRLETNNRVGPFTPIDKEGITAQARARYPLERTINDLILLVATFAQSMPTVLAIEDVHQADEETIRFLTQFAFRACEIPLTLILTCRTSERDQPWMHIFEASLGSDFMSIRLPRLSNTESQALLRFLQPNASRETQTLHISAGNPLFLQCYSGHHARPAASQPRAVTNAAEGMISRCGIQTRSLLQALAVFRASVPAEILRSMYDCELNSFESALQMGIRLGLVVCEQNRLHITYPIVRSMLYSRLSLRRRVYLNSSAFVALQKQSYPTALLADHAINGRMYVEAGTLFRQLASEAFDQQDIGSCLTYYRRVKDCERHLRAELLTPADNCKLGRCYEWTGKQRRALRLYREVLSRECIRQDPESMSTVYQRLAMAFDRTPAADRLQYQMLAIECLPSDSVRLPMRYAALANILIRLGDVNKADEAFRRAEELIAAQGGDFSELKLAQGPLYLSRGDFKGALKHMLALRRSGREEIVLINTLALSYEHLGDLKLAIENAKKAAQRALAGKLRIGQIVALGNLAALNMKIGDLPTAGDYLRQAEEALKLLRSYADRFNSERFVSVYHDAALYAMYHGDYGRAFELLHTNPVAHGFIFEMDRMYCRTVRCKVLLEVGLTSQVRDLLRQAGECAISKVSFVKVELYLLQARLPQIPVASKLECLDEAFDISLDLGTVYQGCEISIALATVSIEMNAYEKAEAYAKRALDIAKRNCYRLLEMTALLLLGRVSTSQERQSLLTEAFQRATEMGLQELIAESAYRLGVLNLELGNAVTAREYLIRSTAITARLAEGVPAAARSNYLGKPWRREAVRALERCNESIPLDPSTLFSPDVDRYFAAAYRFTMAASMADSVSALVGSLQTLLDSCFSRSVLITLQQGTAVYTIPIRCKLSQDLTERANAIRGHAKNRVYFESADAKGKHVTGWIPLASETCEGGIYVACRPHEPQLTEKELELLTMAGAIGCSALRRIETGYGREAGWRDLAQFYGIVGASKAMQEVYGQIKMAAGNTATVLIEGETGCGKELVARAIHLAGPRAKGPFIPVDCGAIPEGLIEAELFGAKRGAFTGAVMDRAGLFESANHGTIFLDEISNTTLALQAKLLRVIQEREIRRVGDAKARGIDVRVVVASNQRLDALSEAGKFRKDLLYRLKVLYIKVPPLRSRREDIPMIAHGFLRNLNSQNGGKKYFAPGVIDDISRHPFPGNVRELQNAIERAYFQTQGTMITDMSLDPVSSSTPATASGGTAEVEVWFKEIAEGRSDFWSAVHRRYKRRDISREKVLELVDFGLRSTRGSYKALATMLRMSDGDYRKFLDFLRRSDCLLDFRPYRKAPASAREN